MTNTVEIHKGIEEKPVITIRDNYKLLQRTAIGRAAHGNRGSYSGTKFHQIEILEIVQVIDPEKEKALPGPTLGKRFLNGNKTIYSAWPICGCTQGQHAAREVPGAGAVTCSKCLKLMEELK